MPIVVKGGGVIALFDVRYQALLIETERARLKAQLAALPGQMELL